MLILGKMIVHGWNMVLERECVLVLCCLIHFLRSFQPSAMCSYMGDLSIRNFSLCCSTVSLFEPISHERLQTIKWLL